MAALQRVLREVRSLSRDPPEGVRAIINEADLMDLQFVVDGPDGTPYQAGQFRIKLALPADFPHAPPKGFFLTKIFHPNVAKNGEICVNTLKKDWKPTLGLKHVLLTIKCLLIVPNPESALNEEAGRLLLEAYDDYFKRAKLMTGIHAARPVVQATAAAGAVDPMVVDGEDADEADGDAAPVENNENNSFNPNKMSPRKRTKDKAADKRKLEKKRSLKRL